MTIAHQTKLNTFDLNQLSVRNDDESNDEKTIIEYNKADWDSDYDNIIDVPDNEEPGFVGYVEFLGFHPYKVVIFLRSLAMVACPLNSAKVQYLGELSINTYSRGLQM